MFWCLFHFSKLVLQEKYQKQWKYAYWFCYLKSLTYYKQNEHFTSEHLNLNMDIILKNTLHMDYKLHINWQ